MEVAFGTDKIFVRNSKSPDRVIQFTPDEWSAFVDGVKKSEFDLAKL